MSETRVAGRSTETVSEYVTTETMSRGSSIPTASRAASLARSIFSPSIDPERSRTRAMLAGALSARAGAVPVSETFTYVR